MATKILHVMRRAAGVSWALARLAMASFQGYRPPPINGREFREEIGQIGVRAASVPFRTRKLRPR